jgi:osmotically-inducible protein OsmY
MKKLKLNEWTHRAAICRWSALLLVGTGMQILVLPPLQAATPAKEITDSRITSAVEDGLILEKGVFPNNVDVSSSQGIVTLSGSVGNLLAKERMVKIAESIRGVRGVVDLTTVTPVSRPDEDVFKDIQMALLQDPATESYQVSASVHGAVATLTGSVGSYAEKQFAARIAKGVKGVKEVRNDVTIKYLEKRTDPEIAADVKSRLQWDIWINGDIVSSAVKDGKVTLSGIIGSALSKSRSVDDAWVNGVVDVDGSGLTIENWTSEGTHRKSDYPVRSDSEIKQALQAELPLDPRMSAFSPSVTVEDGMVTLSGTVGNLKAKTSAEQDAKNIVGVWRVDNLLKVRPKEQPADAEMQKQLKAALSWDPLLDSSRIEAVVTNSVASLSGTVDSSFEKAEVQDVASRIKGVTMVRNHLKTDPEYATYYYDWPYYSYDWPYYNPSPYYITDVILQYPSDEHIKKSIEDAFFWSPFVRSDDVKVTVNGGVATLTGSVGTWIGWGEVDKDAHKSGANQVLNQVKVR